MYASELKVVIEEEKVKIITLICQELHLQVNQVTAD